MQYLNAHEFDNRFTEVMDAGGNLVRPDLTGIDPTSDRLWTVVDVDGRLHLLNGLHVAHRVGYLLTAESWTQDTEVAWWVDREGWGDGRRRAGRVPCCPQIPADPGLLRSEVPVTAYTVQSHPEPDRVVVICHRSGRTWIVHREDADPKHPLLAHRLAAGWFGTVPARLARRCAPGGTNRVTHRHP